jgi:hypothetical protein
MRIRLMMTTIAVAAGLLGLTLTTPSRADGDFPYVETVQVVPTRSVVVLPRTYVTTTDILPTSAIIPTSTYSTIYDLTPTSLYLPTTTYVPTTTYIPTSTYVPTTAYVQTSMYIPTTETTYVYPRRGLFRPRRYVERTYVTGSTYLTPTYYVRPTTVVSGGLVASSMICCETAAPMVQAAPTSAPIRRSADNGNGTERAGQSITSKVAGDPESAVEGAASKRDSQLNPAGAADQPNGVEREAKKPANLGGAAGGAAGAGAPGAAGEADKEKSRTVPNPPNPGPAAKTQGETKTAEPKKDAAAPNNPTPPAPTQLPEPPLLDTIPSPVETLPLPKAGDATRRDSLKPVPTSTVRPTNLKNVLQGKVVAADSKLPEEGVEVMLTDRRNPNLYKTARTNAYGQFAITLPPGDWAINIQMPSGRTLAVERGVVTAGAGKVVDMYGRELPNLVISR